MVYKLPKEAIADDQIDADKISANLIASWVPINGIIMWAGTIQQAEALTNWAICDGANGTPDLRDKFVLGVGSTANASTAAVDDQGGSKDAVVVEHKHSITDPGHFHTTLDGVGKNQYSEPLNVGVGSDGSVNTTGNTDTKGTGITETQDNGVDGTDANMPPYWALCYLMRIA